MMWLRFGERRLCDLLFDRWKYFAATERPFNSSNDREYPPPHTAPPVQSVRRLPSQPTPHHASNLASLAQPSNQA
jgi:hypothetical protein